MSTAVDSRLFYRASLLLAGLMFVLPFLQPYHRYPIPSFYGEWLAFALGLAAALMLLTRESWREPQLPMVALAPLALIGLLGMQIVLGRTAFPEQGLTATLYLAWATLLILLGAALRRAFGIITIATALAWPLLAGGMLNAIAAILQHYQLWAAWGPLIATPNSIAVYGNIGQFNHFANYIALALASTAYLYARGRMTAYSAAACALPMLLALPLCGSRSVWLYLGALAAVALWMGRAPTPENRRLIRFSLCLLPGLVVAQWVVTLPFMNPDSGRLVNLGQRLFEDASGTASRLQLAQEAWALFIGSPVLGAGWGQFTWHHFQYQALTGAAAARGIFNHAHNIVLQLMAETGTAGAAVVVGAALAWVKDRRDPAPDPERGWLFALLAVLVIHSLLEHPLWYSNFLGILAVLLGAGAGQSLKLGSGRIARFAVAACIVVGLVNLAWVLPGYRDFERLLFDPQQRALLAMGGQSVAGAVLKVHHDPILANYVEVAVSSGIEVGEDQLREKLELNSRVMRFAPGDLAVYRQALLLALAGEREAALRQLEWATRVYPGRFAEVAETIAALAGRHPDRFTPLLEWAAAKNAEIRARAVTR